MEQQQYRPDFIEAGFQPDVAPDFNVGSAANQQAQAQANAAIIAQLRADARTMAINDQKRAEGNQALAKFSQTLTKLVEKEAYRQADEDFAEGLLYAKENPSILKLEPEVDAKPVLDAAGKVLAADPTKADIVVPAIRGSRFFKQGVEEGQISGLMSTQYTPFIENYVRQKNPTTAQELAVVLAEAKKEFWSRAPINRSALSNNFLLKKLFPMMTRMDNSLSKQFTNQITSDQSFATQTEAASTFSTNGDVATYLATVAATTDSSGNVLGYRGAWKNFGAMLSEGIQSGTFSEADVATMRNQPIPGDPKGRTYGELHGVHFDKAEKLAGDARRAAYRDSQADRNINFQQQQQQLMDAFGGADADGYTTEQIEDAAEELEAAFPGLQASALRRMASGSVDAKQREKQEQEIQDLQALGLLTPDRLMQYDRKLWNKYMSSAQQQAKLSQQSGQYKTQLDAIKDRVELGPEGGTPITATADGKHHPSVGILTKQMQDMFLKKVQEYAIAGNPDPANAALADVETYFNKTYKDKVSHYGYKGVMPTPEQANANRAAANVEINRLDSVMQTNGTQVLDKPGLFDKAKLEQMTEGYGQPGWSPNAALVYVASKQGVDPLTVLNRQLKANGMDELPATPAQEIVANELSPAQRAALANIGTPMVSTRTMGSLGWKPELVPNGYGPMVERAASANGLQPAQIAAMAEIESNWNPNTPSYNNSSFGLMQIHRASHPEFFATKNWRDPQESLNYGAQYFSGLVKRYGGDMKAAAMAYNGGPGNYDKWARGEYVHPDVEREMVAHGKKYMKALYKYGGGQQVLNDPSNLRPVYITGNIGPTSTGQHLDVKQVGGAEFAPTALDNFVEVDDKEYGRVPLSRVGITGDFASHTVRGSHGIDYGTYSGSKVYLKNGAKVVSSRPSVHGDVLTIQLPNGKQYTFLHGKSN